MVWMKNLISKFNWFTKEIPFNFPIFHCYECKGLLTKDNYLTLGKSLASELLCTSELDEQFTCPVNHLYLVLVSVMIGI